MPKPVLSTKDAGEIASCVLTSTVAPAIGALLRNTSLMDSALPVGISMGAITGGALLAKNLGFFKPFVPVNRPNFPSWKQLGVASLRLLAILEATGLTVKQWMNFMDYSTSETDVDLIKNIAYTTPFTTLLLTILIFYSLPKEAPALEASRKCK